MAVKLFSRNEIFASGRNPRHSVDIHQGARSGRDEDRMRMTRSAQLYWNRRGGRAAASYDTQRIKEMYLESDTAEIAGKKAGLGALALYLDFINLFTMLLQLFGQRRQN